MYMKTKELGWKETQGIQNIGIEDSKGNRVVDQKHVLEIWENYVTELYDRTNLPEALEVEPEEEVDTVTDLNMLLIFHIRDLMSIFGCLCCSKGSVQVQGLVLCFITC
jgi:hypothetical protein